MTSVPVRLTTEERVIASVKALRAAQEVSVPVLAARLGMSRATWFKRMHDGQFTVGEIVSLAELFGVSAQDIINGIGTKRPLAKVKPDLRIVPDTGSHTRHASHSDRPLLNTVSSN